MFDHISNDELTLDLIPEPENEWREIIKFAISFDGYSCSVSDLMRQIEA